MERFPNQYDSTKLPWVQQLLLTTASAISRI